VDRERLRLRNAASISRDSRSVAQPGRAPRSGRGGRRFKSCRSDQFFPKTNIDPPIRPPIQRGTLAEHSRHRTSPVASGIQSHALSHDAPASMRTGTPLGITSVRGFECTAHTPTVGLNGESTCCPKARTIGGLTSAAPVPRVTPRAMSACVRFRGVGCPRRSNRSPMRARDRARWNSTRRRDHR
jgi:hypothetical protein